MPEVCANVGAIRTELRNSKKVILNQERDKIIFILF